jgi:hypothetical protein
MYDPRSGQPIGTFSSPTIGEITNPKTGEKSFGPTGGGYKPYTPPVKAPVNTGGGAQVDRATGAALGDGSSMTVTDTVITPPRNPIMSMSEDARPPARMVPTQEEESIDPYQLQRTTPSMGTMMEPATATARRRARYLSPNMPGWSLGQ